MLRHPLQNDARVKRRPLDRREQLILRRVDQIPSQGDPAQLRIHQHRAIAVVPAQPQKASLPGAIILQALRQRRYLYSRASRNRLEDVSGRRQPRFNPDVFRMHAPRHDPAHPGNQVGLLRHRNDACRRAHHVDHIAFAASRAQRIPVRIECAHRNRNPRPQAQLAGPLLR